MGDNQQASDRQPPIIHGPLSRRHRAILWQLATIPSGEERLTVPGSGVDSNELRENQAGDATGHAGWDTATRAYRPYMRDLHDDQELDVWLLLDLSASIEWGMADYLKRARAIEFAAAVGQLFGPHKTRVGAMLFAERALRFVAVGLGYQHLLHRVTSIQAQPHQNVQGSIDLESALLQAAAVIPRHSLLLIVSDFLAPGSWQLALGQLAQQNEVVAVRIRDRHEDELPNIGLVTFEDPQTGGQLVVDTNDAAVRERFQDVAQAQDGAISEAIVSQGVDLLTLSTDDPLLPVLSGFLRIRRQRQAMAVRRGAMKRKDRSTPEEGS